MTGSLVTRVLSAAGVVLVVFLGLTVAALDIAFRSAAERATRDRLQVQVLTLLASLEVDEDGRAWMPSQLAEPRFAHPGSGLYAQIRDDDQELVWRSPSAVGLRAGRVEPTTPGETVFDRITLDDDTPLFRYRFTVLWDTGQPDTEAPAYHITVAESMDSYHAQMSRFRTNLLGWFGLMLVVLIVAQLFILRRTLRPLNELAAEVAAVERGRRDLVGDRWPSELSGLARNLNALVRNERSTLQRYRNTLGNLAHSLKTPLAVIRVALDEPPATERDATIATQVERMDEIIRYQLQRTGAVGSETFGRAMPVAPMVREVIESMRKVHATRGLGYECRLSPEAVFRGSRGDLLEMVGNVVDNACKWARTGIRVTVTGTGDETRIIVEDDGPGVPAALRESVTSRGIRGDETVDGHGIGLSVVADIVRAHGGSMSMAESEMGGLMVSLAFCDNPGDE